MSEKIRIAALSEFDFSEHLDSDEAIAEYLTAILEDGDASLLAAALGDIAKARGMAQIAAGAGIGREALYKALRPGAQPRFNTVRCRRRSKFEPPCRPNSEPGLMADRVTVGCG